jgi:predicted nuclease of predicted toxin-antitoxin system
MTFWLDAQLPPAPAAWLAQQLSDEPQAVRDLRLRACGAHRRRAAAATSTCVGPVLDL